MNFPSLGSEECWKWEGKREEKTKKTNKNQTKPKQILIQFSAPITINFPQDEENNNLCDGILTLLLRSS